MLTLLWLSAFFGCAPSLPPPTVEAIAPAWGWNGETTDVTVVGTNFLPSVFAYADTRDDHRVYADFEIELIGDDDLVIPLSGVDLSTYRALSGQVPSGHPVGVYDVRVTSPAGEQAVLIDGFSVTETRADHLVIEVQDVAYQVHQTAVFGVFLADPDGNPVGEDLAIEIRADPDQGAEGAVFSMSGLKDMAALDDGVGVRGRLGSDGEATLSVTSELPSGLRLNVEPEDPESFIRGDEVFLDFAPGDVHSVEILLPSDGFSAIAGQGFPVSVAVRDAYDNLVDDQGTDIWIEELCGTYREALTVVGSADVQVAVTGATDDACPENRLMVTGAATGESSPFATVPGMPSTLRVLPAEATATAGEPFAVFVWAEDAYGNTLRDYQGQLLLTDSAGSLASASCEEGSIRYCTLFFERSTEGTVLLVTDDQGATGDVGPLAVLAGPATALTLSGPAGPLTAGEDATVLAVVTDAYGNAADVDDFGDGRFAVDDGAGTASCDWVAETVAGSHELACRTLTAAATAVLTLELLDQGLTAVSSAVAVRNGPLAQVSAVVSPSTVTAGDSFSVSVQATDAYGNAYETQTDPILDVADEAQTLSPATLTLDAQGEASGTFALEAAGDPVTLTFSQAGVPLGTATLTVVAGDLNHLDVSLERPWFWLDDDPTVQVTARDAYGNPVMDFSGAVVLSSQAGAFGALPLAGFVDGVASRTVTFDDAVLADAVLAVADGGETGTSADVDVLDRDCAEPPVAGLTLDGLAEAVSCRVGGVASVTADFSTSSSAQGLQAFHLDDGQGGLQRQTASSVVLSTADEGGWQVSMVVADSDACGAETSARWWVGDADGEPVGPVTVTSSHAERTAGSAANGIATVSLAATTCSGDLASGGTALVRTDLGALGGTTATGTGLAIGLDSLGEASLTWSVATETHAGTATIAAGTGDGASWGETTVDVTGDSARPTLRSVDPSGTTSELLDEVVIVFSEPMAESTLTTTSVTLVDDSGPVTLTSLSLDAAGTTLTVTPDSQLDTSLGVWTLTVTANARDEGGNNRLDGTWSGTGAAYSSVFGAVDHEGLSLVACPAAHAVLTPDGDDGTGDDADSVSVSAEASGTPTWWELSVIGSDGVARRTERQAATSNAATLSWDGRGDDGFIAAPGDYRIEVSLFDAHDNQSTSCVADVTLQQRYGGPE